MNRLCIITVIFLLVIAGKVSGQILSATVSASNNHNVGSTLTGGYTGAPEAGNHVDYEWFYSPSATSIGTIQTYTIVSGDQGDFIYLTVTERENGTNTFIREFSSAPVKVNSYPIAASLTIIGTLKVNSTLFASYSYSDVDADVEGATEINWYRDTDGTGTTWSTSIGTGRTFILTNNELGRLVRFSVTPVALTGSTDGLTLTSANSAAVTNPPPTATALSIAGTAKVGNTLTANYTYSDSEGDIEGATEINWYRDTDGTGTTWSTSIGTGRTYVLTNNEMNRLVQFRVKPVALTGTTDGTLVTGPNSAAVTNPPPTATALSIAGTAKVGNTLTANYTYSDSEGDIEGATEINWYRDTDGTGTTWSTSIGTGRTLLLTNTDFNKLVRFSVTPVALTGSTDGPTVTSPNSAAVTNPPPTATALSIAGTAKVGNTLTANYTYSDSEGDIEGATEINWYRDTDGTGTTWSTSIGTGRTYVLTNSEMNRLVQFRVKPVALTGTTEGAIVTGPNSAAVTNPPPVASVPTISGGLNVGNILTGNYTYSDAEGDIEGNSIYEWLISSNPSGTPSTIIGGATSRTYQLTLADQGQYLIFRVTPVALFGTTNGTPQTSLVSARVNSAPVASSVTITGTAELGATLTGSYSFSDIDGDLQGTSIFEWLRDDVVIPGANTLSYLLGIDDVGTRIKFRVKPVSLTGFPDTGTSVTSSQTAIVTDPTGDLPMAEDLCIGGTRAVGSVISGKYKFTDKFKEQGSEYSWYRGATAIAGATSTSYTLTTADMESEIRFAVRPRNNKGGVGVQTFSAPLAIINPLLASYSVRDPVVALSATPGSGIFYGDGVSGGFFSPESVGEGGPYTINYLLNISLPTNSCTQNASRSVMVNAVDSYFESFRNFYCSDGGHDTIYVSNVPAGSTSKTFTLTNPSAIVGYLADTAIIIDMGRMRPGNRVDTLFFSYFSAGSFYPIDKAFVIDSVGTALTIANLDPAYCVGSVKRFITAEGVYPAGGNGLWTGAILSDLTATTAFVDPSMGTAGVAYPITYRYTSPIGCSSAVISRSVQINPLPDPSFTLNPTYNVDGPQVNLMPVAAGGNFVGPGVFGSTFYPSIAGQGGHELRHYVTDANGCSSNLPKTTTVRKAQGTFSGISGIICYRDTTYSVSVTGLPAGITITGFTSKTGGLTWVSGTANGSYHIPTAGAGIDTLKFSYLWDAVPYSISQPLFIDSIGKITIIGIKDNYCDYEGVVNLRVFVENSTGSGNFSFSGPPAAFANYGTMADFNPSLVPPSATQYGITYTHVSTVNTSGCRKSDTSWLYVNKAPDVSIIKTRTTVNIEEPPLELEGNQPAGIFSGKGVYNLAGKYVFNPSIAGLGKTGILFSYIDTKGCYAATSDTLVVSVATGSIKGINPANQYCYDGLTDTLIYESAEPWLGGVFSGKGIVNLSSGVATFNPAAAGMGSHKILFSYYDMLMTNYQVAQTVNVDSVGQLVIENLTAGAEFCNNDAPFPLFTNREGGFFTGPVTGTSIDPAKGPGSLPVTYTFINSRTLCSSSVVVPVTIHAAPQVSFTEADVCIENDTDTTRFVNNTISPDPVSNWLWEFRDGGALITSGKENPGYLYTRGGLNLVKLTATTTEGCTSSLERTIELGERPVADFYWLNECYHPNDSVHLFDRTLSGSPVIARSWNFFDGKSPLTTTNPRYPKTSEGYMPVEYVVYTNYANCSDTVRQDVFIRPTVVLTSSDDYFETFESGPGGWMKDSGTNNTWSLGTPDRSSINRAASGSNAWYTAFDVESQTPQSSSVSSPCFDFTNSDRPMISLKMFRRFDRNRDGAALQYRIGDSQTWEYLGSLNDGIEWYNSTLIKGRPGGDQIGWTTGQLPDNNWVEARHRLDEVKGLRNVKFRLAYGSDGSSQDNDGVAFDDIRISARSRNVLLEHFTNSSSTAVLPAYQTINSLVDALGEDVINIRYHTNFPGTDQLYRDNPSDMSARVLFYGLSKVPVSVVDGGRGVEFDGIFSHTAQELANDPNMYTNMLVKRSLVNPRFKIEIDPIVSGGMLVVDAKLSALQDFSAENLTLYIAVTARNIESITGVNGETHFRNTLRKMLPDAAGTNLARTWTRSQAFETNGFTWKIENIYDADDIEIIAYVQNNITREIYQTVASGINDITVGVEDTYGENAAFAIFPNPTTGRMAVSFENTLSDRTKIELLDFKGTVVRTYFAMAGEQIMTVDDIGLANGIYVVRMSAGTRIMGIRKLIVSGR